MGDTAGTLRKAMVDGLSYDIMADADITEIPSNILNDTIPTSGRNLRKMTKRSETREAFTIACNPAEQAILKAQSEDTASVPLSYTKADGSKYTCTGWIEVESVTTMDFKATLKMYPETTWEVFVAQ